MPDLAISVFLFLSVTVGTNQAADVIGLPPLKVSTENPQTAEKVSLGRKLFFDKRLSINGEVSCASCHDPRRAFTDGKPVAHGLRNGVGTRNTPSLLNVAYLPNLFWDGRRNTLEEQARDPLFNAIEHGFSKDREVLAVIRGDSRYARAFKRAFKVNALAININHVVAAIASFERSLLSANSAFDRYFYGGIQTALSDASIRGLDLFRGRAGCAVCHTIGNEGTLFTDYRFHSLGIGSEHFSRGLGRLAKSLVDRPKPELEKLLVTRIDIAALGRFVVTKSPSDIARFRTPSLRNVALTYPYMHDGSVATLEEAIDREIYYRSISANNQTVISLSDKEDLLSFLRSLTSYEFAHRLDR